MPGASGSQVSTEDTAAGAQRGHLPSDLGWGVLVRDQMSPSWSLPARPRSPTPWEFPNPLVEGSLPPNGPSFRHLIPPTERGRAGPRASSPHRLNSGHLGAPVCPPPPLEPHPGTQLGLPLWLEPVNSEGPSSGHPPARVTSSPQNAWVCDQRLGLESGVLAQPPTSWVTLGKWL